MLVVGGSRFTPGAVLLAGVAALRAGAGRAAARRRRVHRRRAEHRGARGDGRRPAGDRRRRGGRRPGRPARRPGRAGRRGRDRPRPRRHRRDQRAAEPGPGRRPRPDTALVLDAYALGALSHAPDLLVGAGRRVVLTPNVTEAGHLLGREPGDDLDAEAAELAARYEAVVSLYGHIAAPDGRGWREESGDAGLGTSGSGDVLAGILAGLLARGADPAQAACWGVVRARGQRPAAGAPLRPDRLPGPRAARRDPPHPGDGLRRFHLFPHLGVGVPEPTSRDFQGGHTGVHRRHRPAQRGPQGDAPPVPGLPGRRGGAGQPAAEAGRPDPGGADRAHLPRERGDVPGGPPSRCPTWRTTSSSRTRNTTSPTCSAPSWPHVRRRRALQRQDDGADRERRRTTSRRKSRSGSRRSATRWAASSSRRSARR